MNVEPFYQNRIAELEAQLAEARKDMERLDLLERRKLDVTWYRTGWWQLVADNEGPYRAYPERHTLREAIDAARGEVK